MNLLVKYSLLTAHPVEMSALKRRVSFWKKRKSEKMGGKGKQRSGSMRKIQYAGSEMYGPHAEPREKSPETEGGPALPPRGQVNWPMETSVKPPVRDHCLDVYVAETRGNKIKHNLERILFLRLI